MLTILLAFVILFNNYRRSVSAIYFFVFLILNSLWNLSYGLIAFGGSLKLLALLIGNIAPLFFLIPPLLYFVLKTHLYGHQPFNKWHLLHLLPMLIHFVNLSPYLFSSNEYKLSVAELIAGNLVAFRDLDLHLIYSHRINIFARNLQHIGYIAAGVLLISRYVKQLQPKSEVNTSHVRMFKGLFYSIYAIYFVIVLTRLFTLLGLISIYAPIDQTQSMRIYLNLSALLLLLIPAVLILFPRFIFDLSPLKAEISDDNSSSNKGIADEIASASVVCELSNVEDNSISIEINYEEHQRVYDSIIAYCDQHQPFIKSNFHLQDLASAISVPVHRIRSALKVVRGLSFSDFRNEIRIEFACRMLMLEHQSKTIESIALNSGFASLSNFYEMFKAAKGVTPSMWILQNVNSNIPAK